MARRETEGDVSSFRCVSCRSRSSNSQIAYPSIGQPGGDDDDSDDDCRIGVNVRPIRSSPRPPS